MERPTSNSKMLPLTISMRTEDDFEACARRLKALADPDRLRIVQCLMAGPKNVSQLALELGEDLVKVSHHLGVLRAADVVETEKDGKFVIYRLNPSVSAENDGEFKTLDLGYCRLDLPKPESGE